MPEDVVDTTPEVTGEDTDKGDVTPPESNSWWQFQSKDEAAEWANGIVEKRLARERKKIESVLAEHGTLKAEVERLKPLEDATKTDAQRWEAEKQALAAELEDLRSFKSKAERNDLVREIADEKGLPPRFVARVQGNTPDEIAADIDDLLNVLNDGKPAKPVQRKPKETDGDEPGDKGYSGGGAGGDDGFSVDALLEKVRKQRGSTYAH